MEQIRRRAQAPPVVVDDRLGRHRPRRAGHASRGRRFCYQTLLFYASTAPEHYATLFYGVYDAETRQVRYASAGHVPATLIRRDGAEESHGSTGTVLGLFAKVTMGEAQLALHPGDRLSIVSDGVSERDLVEDDRTTVELLAQ